MDNSLDVEKGLRQGREFLAWLADEGIPSATEALNPITPQYLGDLISWCAIGARTTESQTHREMSSGLSMTVGFKNGTDGNLNMAINAIKACSSPQSFLGINDEGQISTFKAMGNKSSHIVLRGGAKPNYNKDDIIECENLLKENGLAARIMIDCSHDNSNQDYRNQGKVIEDITNQIAAGNKSIFGLMLESNLFSGKQKILDKKEEMQYGVSVTDGCIDWLETHKVIKQLAIKLS
jgi:3-deoxy-7-phosphoheptulonate synthase